MESLVQRIEHVIREPVDIEPYNPQWPVWFQREKTAFIVRITDLARQSRG